MGEHFFLACFLVSLPGKEKEGFSRKIGLVVEVKAKALVILL